MSGAREDEPGARRTTSRACRAEGLRRLAHRALLAPSNVDEKGNVVPTSEVWTGTADTGLMVGGASGSWGTAVTTQTGRRGSAARTDYGWTNIGGEVSCASPARIDCFEN